MTQTIQDLGDRYVFGNDDGTWTVWKQITADANGNLVGPGYIGKGIFRTNGDETDDPFVDPTVIVNDPKIQGLGIVGWHHYRDIPGEPNIWNKGWNMGGNRKPGSDPFGVSGCDILVAPYLDTNGNIRASFGVNFVDRYSAGESKRIVLVRYDYIVEASDVKVWASFTEFPDGFDSGPTPYLKEPKYAAGLGGSTYQPNILDIYDASSGLITEYDLVNDPKLQNPTVGTEQIGADGRTRTRWYDGANYFNIVARGNSPLTYDPTTQKVTNYGSRVAWEGGGQGLDAFAVDANSRAHFDDSVCAAYCLQGPGGTLTRQWEVAKRGGDPHVEIMFHGWEGGSGLPDCLCAARAFKTGNTWVNFFSISRDAGWVL